LFHAIEKRSRISTTQNLAIGSSGQTASLRPLFAIDAGKEGNTFVIRVNGELDLFERPRLEQALREAEASHAIRILLDLEELTFIDAAGLSALVSAWHRSMTDDNCLRITHGKGNVADMLRLTALDMVLPFVPPVRLAQANPWR
jgi:anti-sigma B factor antagonist